jgi:hypothetical protein
MASMSTENAVLRAVLLLSRPRPDTGGAPSAATVATIVARVRDDEAAVERALAALARADLVVRVGGSIRLSFTGLAVAVAAAARQRAEARRPKALAPFAAPPGARVLPMARRRRAAA